MCAVDRERQRRAWDLPIDQTDAKTHHVTVQLAVISTIEVALSIREHFLARELRSQRPLILLVAQVAFIQAPSYLLAHRGIGCCRDNDAVLCDDLAASCLDREVF